VELLLLLKRIVLDIALGKKPQKDILKYVTRVFIHTMTRELENILVAKYPDLLKGIRQNPRTPLFFGVECEDGWYDLINNALFAIQQQYDQLEESEKEDTCIIQIKEKFGGLRLYMSQTTDAMDDIIRTAESTAYKTCEVCGATDNIATADTRYIRTLCQVHMSKHKEFYLQVPNK